MHTSPPPPPAPALNLSSACPVLGLGSFLLREARRGRGLLSAGGPHWLVYKESYIGVLQVVGSVMLRVSSSFAGTLLIHPCLWLGWAGQWVGIIKDTGPSQPCSGAAPLEDSTAHACLP